MIYVGIDPSLTSPGFAVLNEDGSPRGVFNLATRDLRGGERLAAIYDFAMSLFPMSGEILKGHAVIEGYAINAQNRPFDLGEAGGILRLVLAQNRIPYTVVPPALVKKFVTGSGQATKEQVQLCTKRNWGFSFEQEDQCDAFVMGRIARAIHLKVASNPAEKAVLEKITGAKLSPAKPPRRSRPLNV